MAEGERSVDVRFELLSCRVEGVVGEGGCAGADPGVVDEHCDVAAAGGGRGDVGRQRDIELYGDHAGVVEAVEVAGAGVHLGCASVEECAAERGAEASVGAGDEGDGSFDLHVGAPGGPGTGATTGDATATAWPASRAGVVEVRIGRTSAEVASPPMTTSHQMGS